MVPLLRRDCTRRQCCHTQAMHSTRRQGKHAIRQHIHAMPVRSCAMMSTKLHCNLLYTALYCCAQEVVVQLRLLQRGVGGLQLPAD
jgi:hypothetical protein